ncbi:BING4CT-domain-containing protein [Rhizoclosmatium globosum]|uniref:U three protein 7 n=1 Tax=Rhizoclosmatium globosum TaxID=329046 RepID=A0A1Y2AVE5_9FUNG|nr:BING4CT-domain-containing protein [Rhizoclosmatium globosum]|eukprot:ORY26568.1 BING4CT-domain-containing protein [Rhizoclosmatium globosum]
MAGDDDKRKKAAAAQKAVELHIEQKKVADKLKTVKYNRVEATGGDDENPYSAKNLQDKKARGQYKRQEKKYSEVATRAAQSEVLLTQDAGYIEAEGMERTYKFSQKVIRENVDINTEAKGFDLKLKEFGPYAVDYTRNGRNLLIGGRKGHIATFDWKSKALGCELHLKETVRDVKWLHDQTMFAVAQKQYTYIYDRTGMEIHCMRKFVEINRLEFLPYHFLLCGISKNGQLTWQDTSTGSLVAQHRTRFGDCNAMTQNPYNAIINLGHSNGVVSLWSPNMNEPLVKMFCHKGPVKALAVDRGGYYMATSGLDGRLKVWDIRSYKPVHEYYTHTPASELSISQLGMLAVGFGPNVAVWKDAFKEKQKSPYLTHLLPGSAVNSLKFCPYDDVLGVGHNEGITSMIVPGSGEPNYDAFEANPYQTATQAKRREVMSLLDKIQPEMISLNPDFIGSVDRAGTETVMEEKRLAFEANNLGEKFVPKKKARGKSSAHNKFLRKQTNIVDPLRVKALEDRQKERDAKEKEGKRKRGGAGNGEKEYSALDRFTAKKPKW